MNKRVVISGMGCVTPLGNDTITFSKNLFNGTNGVNQITLFDTTNHIVKIAAEAKINLNDYFNSKELNKIDRFTAFSIIAADEAVEMSEINNSKINKDRVGVIIGSGIGGINTFEKQHVRLLKHPKKVSPYFIPTMISDIAAGHIAATLKASKLYFLTDVPGVLDSSKRLIPKLTKRQVTDLIKSRVVDGGMIPKLEACLTASKNNVNKSIKVDPIIGSPPIPIQVV